jgi:RNA polymerase sigma-70 factor (ECF subfamily)
VETESNTAEEMAGLDPLASRIADGDPSAPRELVERHHAELYRYALAMLRDVAAAEDAVQEAFERAFVALGGYPEERIRVLAVRAWLYRITLNVVRNAWRNRNRELPVSEIEDRTGGWFRAVSEPASGEEWEAWLDALEALKRLPDRQRVAVVLRYFQDLAYARISEITDGPKARPRRWSAGASDDFGSCWWNLNWVEVVSERQRFAKLK